MDVYGLTGGIGSGKSTVATLLEEYGIPVVSADELSRIVVAPGSEGLREVAEAFGSEILDDRGELDRAKMASIVFRDAEKRRHLEEILHPRIRESFEQVLDALEKGGHDVAIYEVPLLFEKNLQGEMKAVILVTAPDNVRMARVRSRDDVTETEVRARMAAQMDEQQKRRRADYVIENDGNLDDLRREVEFMLARFLRVPGVVTRAVATSDEDAAPVLIPERDASFPPIAMPAPSRRMTQIPTQAPAATSAVRTGSTLPPGVVQHPVYESHMPTPPPSSRTIPASLPADPPPVASSDPPPPASPSPTVAPASSRTVPAPGRATASVNQPPSAPPLRRPERPTATGNAANTTSGDAPRAAAPRSSTVPAVHLGAPTPPPPPTRPPSTIGPAPSVPLPVVVVPPPPPRTRAAPVQTPTAPDGPPPAPNKARDDDSDPT